MIKINIGRKISGDKLEQILISCAKELGYDASTQKNYSKEYMLNPVRKKDVYLNSTLKILGADLDLEIGVKRNEYLDFFWLNDIVRQESESEHLSSQMLQKEDVPDIVDTPESSIEEYLNLVSQKLNEFEGD